MAGYSLLDGPQGATVFRLDGDRQVVVAGPGLNPDEARRLVDTMNRGDGVSSGAALEWLAAPCVIAAGYFYADTRIALATVAAAVALFYFGQCYATSRLRLPSLRLPRRRHRQRGDRKTIKDLANAASARLRH